MYAPTRTYIQIYGHLIKNVLYEFLLIKNINQTFTIYTGVEIGNVFYKDGNVDVITYTAQQRF
jgi:hypothetical protein